MKQASQLVFFTLPPVSEFLVLQVTVKPAHLHQPRGNPYLPRPPISRLVENVLLLWRVLFNFPSV